VVLPGCRSDRTGDLVPALLLVGKPKLERNQGCEFMFFACRVFCRRSSSGCAAVHAIDH
jgi:hypothetical protein